VNTAFIGNFSADALDGDTFDHGILFTGLAGGDTINLLPYFNGGLLSTNRNGTAMSVDFLDGGGLTPLVRNMPALDSTSNQL